MDIPSSIGASGSLDLGGAALDLISWISGIYQLVISSEEGQFCQRLIIE